MVTLTACGFRISVESWYQKDYSNPLQEEFMHAYRVTIENLNPFPVRLIKRHWQIFDPNHVTAYTQDQFCHSKVLEEPTHYLYRTVTGEGVAGFQPLIQAGERFDYISGFNVHHEVCRAHGSYTFINLENNRRLVGIIPTFPLVVPYKLN